MQFDSNGLPRDNGADDYADSARLAGLMALLNHPQAPDLRDYVVEDAYTLCRHPTYPANDFSRDQLIPFLAGLCRRTGTTWGRDYTKYKPSNGDWLSPSQQDHIRMCCYTTPTKLGRAWLWLDILYSCYVDPVAEPNQLIAMLVIAGPRYLNFWKRHNPRWRASLQLYWCGWRNEPAWCSFMIQALEVM